MTKNLIWKKVSISLFFVAQCLLAHNGQECIPNDAQLSYNDVGERSRSLQRQGVDFTNILFSSFAPIDLC